LFYTPFENPSRFSNGVKINVFQGTGSLPGNSISSKFDGIELPDNLSRILN